ncbi:MAG: 2-oxoacid:acceptor oxidoreductase subunit alpha [Candidatus Nealsonbacteria bacterium]|nr:MAG: 2-oxoacid:acceptor oxidoreductase subunit alpha [Candidatus Nealsonbacteria bacterium]
MEKTILIGGKAGQGTAVTSHFIGKVFCALGYYVFNYRDYPSLIRGGHNFNVLRISDKPVYSHKDKYDIILAFDQKTINLHQKNLKREGFILGDKTLKTKRLQKIDIQPILSKLKAPKIIENDILIGWLFKYFGVDKNFLLKEAEKVFKGKKTGLIKKAIEKGYSLAPKKERLKRVGSKKYFISGSQGIGIGALNSGIDIYIAYPMTPATPVLHFLAGKQLKDNILVLQLENEISVINSALGASFAGAKTMVGTSGGGFALMTEAMSLASISELPLVVYLAQRTGPATGVPTYTAQSDLKFAVNAGHGEFPRIVVAPGDSQEAILRTQEAFYLSLKYRTLAIIIGDKHVAESDYSFDTLKVSPLTNQKFILKNPPKNYKSYKITKNGVSPRAVPGQEPVIRATSYGHNEYGNTIEDAKWTIKMNDKRFKKVRYLEKEISKLNPVSIYGKGKNLIIAWGSTKGAILDSLPELKSFRFLQVSYISPFPKKVIENEIKKSKRVVLVENNATGLLGDIIAEKTGFIIKEKILKYDARPFVSDYIINKVKKKK